MLKEPEILFEDKIKCCGSAQIIAVAMQQQEVLRQYNYIKTNRKALSLPVGFGAGDRT